MDSLERSSELDHELRRAVIDARVAPRAVAGWLWSGAGRVRGEWGGQGADFDSVFDLGSVTKPCVALLAGVLEAQGELSLEQYVGEYLPELRGGPLATTSVGSLLRHEGRLEAHRRLYAGSWGGRPIEIDRLPAWLARFRSAEAGPTYSDLGYILVGMILERSQRTSLDVLLSEHLFGPWGLEIGSARAFLRRGRVDFVETEVQPARGGLLRGQVHDDNAWALSGSSCSGHAGLFGTLRGVLQLGALLLTSGTSGAALSPGAKLAGLSVVRGLGDVADRLRAEPSSAGFSAGFMHKTGTASSAGRLAGPQTFGHLGFPGVSFWCDPDRRATAALLTNRVFPRRSPFPGRKNIAELRREQHDFLWGRVDAARGP